MNKWGLPKISEEEKGLGGVRTWHWGWGTEPSPFGCFLSLAPSPATRRISSSLSLSLDPLTKKCKVINLIKKLQPIKELLAPIAKALIIC